MTPILTQAAICTTVGLLYLAIELDNILQLMKFKIAYPYNIPMSSSIYNPDVTIWSPSTVIEVNGHTNPGPSQSFPTYFFPDSPTISGHISRFLGLPQPLVPMLMHIVLGF